MTALLTYPGNVLVAVSAKDNDEYSINTFQMDDPDEQEQASSGDEDELFQVKELILGAVSATTPTMNSANPRSSQIREPLLPSASDETNKLPFRFRKLRYFDAVSAKDRHAARQYLKQELRKWKRRAISQRLNREPQVLDAGMSRFDGAAKLSAALLLESLLLNPLESVEGMAKCYDGIVAAGVALQQQTGTTRNQVLKALRPLLISSLEQPSGQVILTLAKLRRLCGTPRYQRRFVQRIAPCLIRPARGAPWCLRHQHDMEPILAACELIFDSAEELFAGNWYETGRQLLRDSVRKQTLNVAAQQLKDMSPAQPSTFWPARRFKENLAEWEVMAVDQQIRISIASILTRDWSKVVVPLREPDLKNRRRIGGTNKQVLQSPKSPTRHKSNANKFHSIHGAPPMPDEFDAPMSPVPGITKTPPRSPSSPPNTPISIRESLRSPPPPSPHDPPVWFQPTPPITPLSPLSSSDHNALYRVSSNVSIASTGSSHNASTTQSQPTHYRMLTSTAAERKRTVAACRALRSQIQRFEEAFLQLHGRPPKGASERAPLATTYAQYREWKRAIRADAACRIQALVRGARTRWMLLRSSNARLARVVMTRAGRTAQTPAYQTQQPHHHQQQQLGNRSTTNATLDKLSIPMEFSTEPDRQLSLLTPIPHVKKTDSAAMDVFTSTTSRPTGPVTPPVWSTSVQPRRSLSPNSFSTTTTSTTPTSSLPTQPSITNVNTTTTTTTSNDLMHLSLPELQIRKRDLKQQLKQYDMNFARKHGRMPVKAEKEPIRHVYEMYNTLKSRISALELEQKQPPVTGGGGGGGGGKQPPPPQHQQQNQQQQQQQSRTAALQRTPSPPLSLASMASSSGSGRYDADSSPEPISRVASRQSSGGGGGAAMTANVKSKSHQQQQQQQQQQQPMYGGQPDPSLTASLGSGPAFELANLKTEKAKLHQMLRSYEKDFFKEHGRQVSSFAEIKPVASQYRRYKEIKKAIAALQLQVDGK